MIGNSRFVGPGRLLADAWSWYSIEWEQAGSLRLWCNNMVASKPDPPIQKTTYRTIFIHFLCNRSFYVAHIAAHCPAFPNVQSCRNQRRNQPTMGT